MTQYEQWPLIKPLPVPVCQLILLYEGSIVTDYMRCLIRRMCVNSYKKALSYRFRFAMLPTWGLRHLAYLINTQLQCIETGHGRIAKNVNRVHLKPWVELINKYDMKAILHSNALLQVPYIQSSSYPFLNCSPHFRKLWFQWQKALILK